MTKIVMLDEYALNPGDIDVSALERLGEVTRYLRTDDADAAARIADADIVLVNKTAVDAAAMAANPGLKYVGVLATGYNIVDVAAARARGVVVTNVPTYGTAAVAQHAMALLLEICHHVGAHDAAVKQGRWAAAPDWCFWDYPLIELAGKTMGIVGLGRIGQASARMAQALGMNVLAHDAQQNKALESATLKYTDLDTLLAQSDVVALHCPLTDATRGLINKASIAKMKDGAILINDSRGPLVVEQDLADALNAGKLYAAGLDVLDEEPALPHNPLLTAKNCFVTPHIAWAPKESRQRLFDTAVDNMKSFLAGAPKNVVS